MRNTLIAVLVALILGTGVTAWFLTRTSDGRGTVITGQTAVVKEIRELGRLETTSFTIEKIIEAKKDGGDSVWRDVLFGDKLLLIAHGEVVAGLDLSGLDENAMRVTGGTMRLTLPAPIIFSTRLDNEQTRVYDRDQGYLARGDKDLESEARLAAEQAIRDAACESKILDSAAENAQKQIKALLSALGYENAIVEIPPASC